MLPLWGLHPLQDTSRAFQFAFSFFTPHESTHRARSLFVTVNLLDRKSLIFHRVIVLFPSRRFSSLSNSSFSTSAKSISTVISTPHSLGNSPSLSLCHFLISQKANPRNQS